MGDDDELRRALEGGAGLALVRVRTSRLDRAGTRSQTTAYDVDVVRAPATPALPRPLVLKHFGRPLMSDGHGYAVAIIDSGRHHGAWEVPFAAPLPDDGSDEAWDAAWSELQQRAARVLGRPAS